MPPDSDYWVYRTIIGTPHPDPHEQYESFINDREMKFDQSLLV